MKDMIKKILCFAAVICCCVAGLHASSPDPVKWSMEVIKTSSKEGTIRLTAEIEKEWHMYGTKLPKGGPKATVIDFSESRGLVLKGGVVASPAAADYQDEDWGMILNHWNGKVVFTVPFSYNTKDGVVECAVRYMTCNGSNCLPPVTKKMSLPLNKVSKR